MKYPMLLLMWLVRLVSQAQIPSDSLKAYYTFNGTYADSSAEENNITAGSGEFAEDRFGNANAALYLNGLSDSLTLPVSEFSPITGDFTISFWYATNSFEIMNCFSSKQSAGDTTNNFEIQFNSHNSYYLEYLTQAFYQTFVYWNGSGITGNTVAEGAPGLFSNNEWCHFLITREADTFRIYRNHYLYYQSIETFYGGTLGDAVDLIFSAAPYHFKGTIDDMRLYNRSLRQNEIDLLWFENHPFIFTTVKKTDAYVQGSNVLVYWEYDTSQVSDSILVEYRINSGDWITAIHSNMAYENYTYINMSYPPGTTAEVRVSDFSNPDLTNETGAFIQSEYDWVEVSAELPFPAKDGAGLLNFKDKMWLLGGWDPPNHPPNYTHSEVWSSSDGENWTFETTAPWPARHISGWLSSGDALWVIGGDPQSNCLTDVWKSTDGINWTETNNAIPGFALRMCSNYAYADEKLIIYGGEQCSGNPLSDVWSSADGISWEHIADAPWSGRGMQLNSCVDDEGQIWMIGGSNETTRRPFNEVWKSADGITWTLVNASAPWNGRYWHTTAWFDNKMWLLAGMAYAYEMNDAWYSSDGITWHELKSTTGNWPPGSRHAQSTTVFDNALWYMCGILTNNAWKIINTSPVAVEENNQLINAQISVFPNPSDNSIKVSIATVNNSKNTILIFNTLGDIEIEKEIMQHDNIYSTEINISTLPGGLYFIKIKDEPYLSAKFIKQ